MKKLTLVATGFLCLGLLGACSNQGMESTSKQVYLKFWASWCSTCLSTLADSNELSKEGAGKDYVVLSVVAPSHNGEKSAEDFKSWYQSLD